MDLRPYYNYEYSILIVHPVIVMSHSLRNYRTLLAAILTVLGLSLFVTPAQASCGPYADVTVKGSISGVVWGSGPYGERSDFNAAAVHAGLIGPNETATIRRTSVGATTLTDSVQNNVSSFSYSQSMCAVTLSVVDTPVAGAQNGSSTTTNSGTSGSTGAASGNASEAVCPTYPDILVTGVGGRTLRGAQNKVIGTDTYSQSTIINNLGQAVVHAGLVKSAESAIIRRTSVGVVEGFDGSSSHNVVSESAPSGCGYTLSVVSKVSAKSVSSCTPYNKELTVRGTKAGEVWGDAQHYTDNSNMGAAAVHAGLLKDGEIGGVVLSLYGAVGNGVGVPVARNGVTPRGVATSDAACLYTIGNSYIFPLRQITENISSEYLGSHNVATLWTDSYVEQTKRLLLFLIKTERIVTASYFLTGGFGVEMRFAIKEYQYEKGIARSGDEGYGEVGPKTRAVINAEIDAYNTRGGVVVNNFMNGTNTVQEPGQITGSDNTPTATEELLARIQELQRQIAALTGSASATNTNSNSGTGSVEVSDIRIGDQVETTDRVHVRTTPSPDGFSWGTYERGKVGIVLEGPKTAGGFVWWKIQYIGGQTRYDSTNGLTSDNLVGWTAGKYLRLTEDAANARNSGDSGGAQIFSTGDVIVGKITGIDTPVEAYFGSPFKVTVTMKNTTDKKGITRAKIGITGYPQLNISIANGGYFETELAAGASETKTFEITIKHATLNATKVPAWDAKITSSTHWDAAGMSSNLSEEIRVLPAVAPSSDKEVYSSRLGKYVSCGEYPSEEGCACTGPAGQSLSWNPFSTASVACSVYIGGIKIPYGISYLTNVNAGFTGRGAVQCKDTGVVSLVKELSTCSAQ